MLELLGFVVFILIVVGIACWAGRGSDGTGGSGWDNWGVGGG